MDFIPNPMPPASKIKIDSVIGTLVGSQFGLLGGQGCGAPLPFPGWAMQIDKEVIKNKKVNNIENNFSLIASKLIPQFK